MNLSKGQIYTYYDHQDDGLEVIEVLDIQGDSVHYLDWGWGRDQHVASVSDFNLFYKRFQLTARKKARWMWLKFRVKQWLLRQVNRIQIPE